MVVVATTPLKPYIAVTSAVVNILLYIRTSSMDPTHKFEVVAQLDLPIKFDVSGFAVDLDPLAVIVTELGVVSTQYLNDVPL
jgi:hypothetical protein